MSLGETPLIIYQSPRSAYRDTIISPTEIFCSPDCTQAESESNSSFKIKSGVQSIKGVLELLPNLNPSMLLVKVDASLRNAVVDLDCLSCPKVLIIGDTHHMFKPIRRVLSYAKSENFDVILVEHNRNHLHYYLQAGLNNLIWIPGFNTTPHHQPFTVERFKHVVFIGSVGKFHPYRKHILSALAEYQDIPLHIQRLERPNAAKVYSQAHISLNISLNGDLNFRIFEVISSGGFLLTDRLSPQSGLNLLFCDGEHFVSFSNVEDLIDKVRYFLQHPIEAAEIARRGCEHYWVNYAPDKNITRLMNYLKTGEIENMYRAEYEPRCLI
jgi:hypothetical protein